MATDKEVLQSVQAKVKAIDAEIQAQLTPTPTPTPVDEVVERVLVSKGELSECQPNNFKHQAEFYEYRTVVEAQNGGKVYDGPRMETVFNSEAEACVYVPPTGVVRYFIEIGNHDHAFTSVQAMKDWVIKEPSGRNVLESEGGEPCPCRLNYEVLSGPKSFTFPTFAEFSAFIATFVQTEGPPSNEPKPGPVPPQGWAENLCLPAVHPEVRVYTSFQWHWNKAKLHDLDEINTAHMHGECCIPTPGQRVGGLLKLDFKPLFFHMQGFIFRELQLKSFDAGARVVSVDKYYNGKVIDQHIQDDMYVPCVIDMSGATTTRGPSFRADVLAYRETAEGREDHTLIIEVYDRNWFSTGRKMFKPTGGETFTALPYLGVRMLHYDTRNPNDTNAVWKTPFAANDADSGEWQCIPDGPLPLTFRAAWNPNLHAHPPSYGTILKEGVFDGTEANKFMRVTKPDGMLSGDRALFRVADLTGVKEHGASAALIVVKLR